jgi:hypothetical protein
MKPTELTDAQVNDLLSYMMGAIMLCEEAVNGDLDAALDNMAGELPNMRAMVHMIDPSFPLEAIDNDEDDHDQFRTDTEADSDVLRSAGMGTDEDYEHNSID